MTATETQLRDELAAMHYDFYKDVHGIRPRWYNYDAMTVAELEAELAALDSEAKVEFARQAAAEQAAAHDFEIRVQQLISAGARDRATALRWIHEAEGSNGDDEYLCYLVGLPYRYFAQVA